METQDFDILHSIHPGKHFYQFYKNVEDYLEMMTQYFQMGLQKGEACLWIVSEKWGLAKVSRAMEQRIPDFFNHLGSGQLQMRSAELWYLKDGHFNAMQALTNASAYLEQILKQGYPRLRGAGDASAIPRMEWPRLRSYEQEVDTLIKSAPVIAACAYPILDCTLQDTKMVIECHDGVLIGRL